MSDYVRSGFTDLVIRFLVEDTRFRVEIEHALITINSKIREEVDPHQLIIARNWQQGTKYFCVEVLGVDNGTANALARAGLTPEDVLTYSLAMLMDVSHVGKLRAQQVVDARKAWRPNV